MSLNPPGKKTVDTRQDEHQQHLFQVDPSWYERYWWCDSTPDRTACRAYKANRERLLRAPDAMKVAITRFVRIVSAALKLRRRGDYR